VLQAFLYATLENWGDHPHTQEGDKRECINYRDMALFSLLRKVYSKLLEKRCREMIEATLEDTQDGSRPGPSTED